MKLLEENLRGRLLDIGLGNKFLDFTSKAMATKQKVEILEVKLELKNKWSYRKNS